MTAWALVLGVCFLTSAVATRVAVGLLWRGGLIDTPNERSSHHRPTPRGGGVVFVTGLALTAGRSDGLTRALLVGGTIVAAVGLLDDLRPLPVVPRLLAHLGAGVCVSVLVGGSLSFGGWQLVPWLDHVLVTFLVVALVNAFNFMDGIDGLTASHAVVTAVAVSMLAALSGAAYLPRVGSLLAAAVTGFLVWNWPPAKLFMGDVGSGFLGFALATLSVAAVREGLVGAIPVLLVQAVFLIDTGATVVKRMRAGERWLAPHRTHAYQRAARLFEAHRPVVIRVIAIDVVLAGVATVAHEHPATSAPLLAVAAAAGVTLWWTVQRRADASPTGSPNGRSRG